MKKKNGFTLLELLIVVLIIAILAAIALPQYRLAKDKAIFSRCQLMVTSLIPAYKDYLLIHNNSGTNKFEDLSISAPSNFEEVYNESVYGCISNNEMYCCITKATSSNYGQIYCLSKDWLFGYNERILDKDSNSINIKECVSIYNNKRGQRLCKAVAGRERFEVHTFKIEGNFISYDRYKL